MMKGELERFSRRELANVIAFSNSDEFKSTVVMLKLLQGSIISEASRHPPLPSRSLPSARICAVCRCQLCFLRITHSRAPRWCSL